MMSSSPDAHDLFDQGLSAEEVARAMSAPSTAEERAAQVIRDRQKRSRGATTSRQTEVFRRFEAKALAATTMPRPTVCADNGREHRAGPTRTTGSRRRTSSTSTSSSSNDPGGEPEPPSGWRSLDLTPAAIGRAS